MKKFKNIELCRFETENLFLIATKLLSQGLKARKKIECHHV